MPFDPETAGTDVAPKSSFDPEVAGAPAHTDKPASNDLTPMQRVLAAVLGPPGLGQAMAISGKKLDPQQIKSMLMNGGGAVAGQAIGALGGPLAEVTIPLGGAIGGFAGNIADQVSRPGEKFKWGELAAQTALGAVPGAPLEAMGAKAIAREALKQGAAGLAAKTLEIGLDEGRLPTAGEAALSSVVPAIGGGVAQKMQAADPAIQKAIADAQLKTSVKRQTLQEAQKLGLVVPPSMVNPNARAGVVESIAEKGPVRQQASAVNQEVVDNAVRREVNLPENAPINVGTLDAVRAQAGEAYRKVGELADNHQIAAAVATVNPQAAQNILEARTNLEALKQARADATGYYKLADRSADPAHLKLARQYEAQADVLEDKIADAAKFSGQPEVYQDLLDARRLIAKTYTVERALNLGNGTVSAKDLGKAFDKGVPLDGDLKTVAKFALAFPKVVQDSTQVASAGVSMQSAGLGAIAGGLIGTSTHNPAMTVAATLAPAMASAGARKLLLSKPYQQAFARVLDGKIQADPNLLALILREGSQSAGQQLAPSAP